MSAKYEKRDTTQAYNGSFDLWFYDTFGIYVNKEASALAVVQGPLLDSILFPTTTYSLHCHDGSYTWSEENSPQSTQLKS